MRLFILCLWGLCASAGVSANPVDWHPQDTMTPGQMMVSATSTHFNAGLDFTQGRDRSPSLRGTKSGDYRGNALSWSWQFLPHWAVRVSGAERVLEDVADQYQIRTWETSMWTQQAVQVLGSEMGFARLSAWGNRADSLQSSTSKTVGEAVLTQSKIVQPRDQTLSLEGGLTWSSSPAWKYHAVIGMGWTELKYQDFQANGMRNGCEYQLQVLGSDVVGTRIDPCAVVGAASQFSTPLSAYGLDLPKELSWTAQHVIWGGGLQWTNRWGRWRAGATGQTWQRNGVDEIIAKRNATPVVQQLHVRTEWMYPLAEKIQPFVGFDYFSSFLLQDVPMLYNSGTSANFSNTYSQFRAGLKFFF
ncbi:MAG: hypothetical protein EBQ82_12135 [Betaproteobacteria bacterium]|nr:hypothetical protein [Betaproteobacteria bacterium]NBY06107.1 hypothetical protein [Betaproteobacteria bacterium]